MPSLRGIASFFFNSKSAFQANISKTGGAHAGAVSEGFFVPENYTYSQGTVDYAGRPRTTRSKFPAIAARTMVVRNNTNGSTETLGPWETLPFKGNGTYNFNIGIKFFIINTELYAGIGGI